MGSSTTAKHKHKKEKKHKRHRSKSPKEIRDNEEEHIDLTRENNGRHRHHRHKKHKEHHRDRHHKHRERNHEERCDEVIALAESDSDSSDCVEVPLDSKSNSNSERERSAPPPPTLSKHFDYEDERRRRLNEKEKERERIREKDRERERERERFKERERAYERAREKEKERERYEKERDIERRRERDSRDEEIEREVRKDRERKRERDSEKTERECHTRQRLERSDRASGSSRDIEKIDRDYISDREKARERDFSPIPENGVGDCLTIAETNKLRAKLGLKPLEEDLAPSKPSTSAAAVEAKKIGDKDLLSYKDEWGEFLHKPAEDLKEKAKSEKMREKLQQRKERRYVEEKLARIKTLGESDDEVDDIAKWVQRNKKVVDEKKAAEERAKALEELDQEFGVENITDNAKGNVHQNAYTEKHLRGLKVNHDMDEFSEGKMVILTLKDAEVLDEKEGDTLININMLDDARYRKNVANKKKNPLAYGYNVYEEQYDELGNPIERSILEKYDEDLDGNRFKTKNFVIGENLDDERNHQRKLLEIKTKLAGKRLETLADTTITLASDTFTETEIAKFKKPKKKVKRLRQKLKADDLLPLAEETSQLGSRATRHRSPGDEYVSMESEMSLKIEEDDEDLERVLSKARKLKQKENIIKKSLPDIESMQTEIKTEIEDDNVMNSENNRDAHIILNATAEFCRTLGDIPTYGMAGNRDEDSNDMMDFETNENAEEKFNCNKDEMTEVSHGTWNSVNPDEVNQPADLDNIADEVEEVAILDEEPDVGAGVANALRLALSKGYLEKEDLNRPSNSKMAHLQAKNYSIEDKNTAEDDKFGRRDRFHAGPIMDFKDKSNFNPNVKLEYIDDNGRILNLKEAFRYLSHKFHGKGPGKNKIEKRLKKMEQEGLMKTMSSTDTPLGTLTMLQQKQKETKTPYVVLSGGKQTTNNVAGSTISKFK